MESEFIRNSGIEELKDSSKHDDLEKLHFKSSVIWYNEEVMAENLKKVSKLRKEGVDPYPYCFKVNQYINDLDLQAREVSIAGRLMEFLCAENKSQGVILDSTGSMRFIYNNSDNLDEIRILKYLNFGDIIGLSGDIVDGVLQAKSITILSKIVVPPIEIIDDEDRIEYRHVEMIHNQKLRAVLRDRAEIIRHIRDYFNNLGYLEIDTPLLHPYYGGADEEPIRSFYKTLGQEFYLAISPELYLKRLMVGGFERVFCISKNFREDAIDKTHHPEFTTIEYYQAYSDYADMMVLTETLFESIARKITGSTVVEFKGSKIDYAKPWKRMSFYELIRRAIDSDIKGLDDSGLRKVLKDGNHHDEEVDKKLTKFQLEMSIFEKMVQPKIIQPTFVIDWPKDSTPPCYAICLCKTKRGDENLLERFEVYVGGMELANAYSELNDAFVQNEIFDERQSAKNNGKVAKLDPYFNHAIMAGMPPAGGVGIGIDRLVMLMTNTFDIRDVIAFPMINRDYI